MYHPRQGSQHKTLSRAMHPVWPVSLVPRFTGIPAYMQPISSRNTVCSALPYSPRSPHVYLPPRPPVHLSPCTSVSRCNPTGSQRRRLPIRCPVPLYTRLHVANRSEEHTSELQSPMYLVFR